MTTPKSLQDRLGRPTREQVLAVVFGDRTGLVLFLGALAFSALTWRIGIFVTDTWTLANAFGSLADGQLSIGEIVYGPASGLTPGMNVVDGRLYGRNYGQLVLALPVLWLLWAVAAVADPALVLVALFSSVLLGFFVHLGKLLDRETTFVRAGVGVALLAFALNVPFAVELEAHWYPIVALQLSTMIAAALIVVATYRLLARMYGSHVGVFAGAVLALASPVPFWATVPKRHSLTTLLVLVSVYCFYRSRAADGDRSATRFHALTYVPVGFVTWINAALGLTLLVALLIADAPRVDRFGRRRIAVVAAALAASLLPFFLTNWLISGNPLKPPRMLPRYMDGETVVLDDQLNPTSGGSGGDRSDPGLLGGLVATVVARFGLFVGFVTEGLDAFLDGERLYHTFLRSGYLGHVRNFEGSKATSLAVLEWTPWLAGLVAGPVVLLGALGRWAVDATPFRSRLARAWRTPVRRLRDDPVLATDLLVVTFSALLLALFLPRLPNQATWTVRYLHPLYVFGVYGLVRLAPLRTAIREDWRLVGWSYAAFLLVGGQLLVAVLASIEPTQGEAVQFHALVGVGLGTATVVSTVAYVLAADRLPEAGRRRLRRAWAVVFAAGLAATTTLLVLWAWVYFPYGQFALPAVGELAEAMGYLR